MNKLSEELERLRIRTEADYKIVDKSWGFERWIENNSLYCGKELVCLHGKWSSEGKFHYHKKKDEVFYVLSGILELEVIPASISFGIITESSDRSLKKRSLKTKLNVWEFLLKEGDSLRIFPNWSHRFRAMSKPLCRIIEFSTRHSDKDSYYV